MGAARRAAAPRDRPEGHREVGGADRPPRHAREAERADGRPGGPLRELLDDDPEERCSTRAVQFRDEHTQRVADYDAFKQTMEGRPGFVIAPWCGSADCEAQIKTDTQATIRNMPLNRQTPSGTCIRCDKPAIAEAWFAKAY